MIFFSVFDSCWGHEPRDQRCCEEGAHEKPTDVGQPEAVSGTGTHRIRPRPSRSTVGKERGRY